MKCDVSYLVIATESKRDSFQGEYSIAWTQAAKLLRGSCMSFMVSIIVLNHECVSAFTLWLCSVYQSQAHKETEEYL